MRVQRKGKCRGDGKLYELLRISGGPSGELRAFAFAANGEHPCGLVRLSQDEYVLVAVDLCKRQRIRIERVDGKDDVQDAHTMWVLPKVYSLASKINGVFRRELCARIRNIDSSGIRRGLIFTCEEIVPALDSLIIHGKVSGVVDRAIQSVIAFDLQGREVSRGALSSSVKYAYSDAMQSGVVNATYSVRVPEKLPDLCLALVDDAGSLLDVSKVYKRKAFKKIAKNVKAHYCDAGGDPLYAEWFSGKRLTEGAALAQCEAAAKMDGPLFSVIVPLYKTPLSFFREMADSVIRQTYPRWELILVNSTPEDAELHRLAGDYVRRDERIRVVDLEGNLGITENTNVGIRHAKGDYLCFFDHDDVLEPDILFEYARVIMDDPAIDLLYCDEDKLYPDGKLGAPTLKPDFSIDMIRDNNYVCHLLTVRRGAYDAVEPSTAELDGAQDHAMVLKISELGGHIHHVPKILYHWRISETSTAANAGSKPYATEAGIKAVQQHLDRLGIPARVSNSHGRPFRYRVDYLQDAPARASLVVPTRGDAAMLARFFEMLGSLDYPDWELILVMPAAARLCIEGLVGKTDFAEKVRICEVDEPFCMPVWLNLGASLASGDCFVFMHDDVKGGTHDWLKVLSGFAMREDVGAVGTMTCDQDGAIQQAGLSFVGDTLVRLSARTSRDVPGYIFYPLTVRNVAAVSGVCLATSRDAFQRIGGFDERYSRSYYDVDYCLRAESKGLGVVYTPEAWMYHDAVRETLDSLLLGNRRPLADKSLLLEVWSGRLEEGDRFFNGNLSGDPARAELYKLDRQVG